MCKNDHTKEERSIENFLQYQLTREYISFRIYIHSYIQCFKSSPAFTSNTMKNLRNIAIVPEAILNHLWPVEICHAQ